jgi:SAM-dependent methyltransferase
MDYLTERWFRILRCERCGLHRTALPPGQDLSEHYGPSYYGEEGRRFGAAVEKVIAGFRRVRAYGVSRRAEGRGRILDIGCGRGLMLAALEARGWSGVGTEASQALAEAVQKNRGVRVLTVTGPPLPLETASVDVVTSWHSLEHLEHPVSMLAEIHRILKPDGLLILEVPNAESVQARWGRGLWFHLDAPRHRYHFGRTELRGLLVRQGFGVIAEGTFSLEYGPFGMIQTLLNRMTSRPNVLFQMLKRRPASGRTAAWWRDAAVTVALALPVGVVGTAAELAAAAAGRGGVARWVARKTGTPATPPGQPPEYVTSTGEGR